MSLVGRTVGAAVALAFSLCARPALALDPAKQLSQYGHRSWTQQQGLPQDSVRAIAQAPDGSLWIGTDEGLARFDGVEFTAYRQREGGLANSVITAPIAATAHLGAFTGFDGSTGRPWARRIGR